MSCVVLVGELPTLERLTALEAMSLLLRTHAWTTPARVADAVLVKGSVMSLSHEIHTSEIRSFLGCRRRWNWAYRERIVPEISARPLQFGIAFHIAMETFYNPHFWSSTTPEDKTRRAINAFIGECERQ